MTAPASGPIRAGRVRARDVVVEACVGAAARPGRSLLTAVGTILGVGTLVVTLGLAATASAQVNQRFDAVAATEVVLTDTRPAADGAPAALPGDVASRVAALDGVVHAGLLTQVDHAPTLSTLPGGPARSDRAQAGRLPVYAAAPGAQAVIAPRLTRGRLLTGGDERTCAKVVLLSAAAARSIGVEHSPLPRTVSLDGVPFDVVGIYDDTARHAETLLGGIVPSGTASATLSTAGATTSMLVQTRLGAATVVARQAPYAALPHDPTRLAAATAPDPTLLRGQVRDDLTLAFVVLAAAGLLLGAIGIASTTLVSVLERVAEIGLRRALGAQPGAIATQFVLESGLTGTFGGVVGASLGTAGVVLVAVTQGWTPVLSMPLVIAAAACGTLTGLAAGLYPAWRAARLAPVDALGR